MDSNLHSPERRLIELRMEHADLDAMVDRASEQSPVDELMMRRLKKRRLALRDPISRLELALDPKEPRARYTRTHIRDPNRNYDDKKEK